MDHHFAGKPLSAGPFGNRADIDHMPDTPYRGGHHRRAQSETFFRFPDDILLEADADVDIDFNLDLLSDNTSSGAGGGGGGGGGGVPMAVDSSKSKDSNCGNSSSSAASKPKSVGPVNHFRSLSVDADFFEGLGFSPAAMAAAGEGSDSGGKPAQEKRMHHHRHSNSMDGSTTSFEVESFISSDGVKKSMGPDRLAELALIDPKRAKRILANRQSAARSKERKIRYTNELEKKVQTLQTEATTLSAQVTMLQRDTTGLTTENKELKLRLQAMEQQASLREALNEALREEVQRLKIATGQIPAVHGNSFNRGLTPQFSSHPQPLHHFGSQHQQLHMPPSSTNNQSVNGQSQSSFLDFNHRV